jgi:hypothetical protein
MVNNETLSETETILAAAIHILDNNKHLHQPLNVDLGYVISGYRHCCCYPIVKLIYSETKLKPPITEGFITSHFRFVNRTEAFQIAKNAFQIISDLFEEEKSSLKSEDLW